MARSAGKRKTKKIKSQEKSDLSKQALSSSVLLLTLVLVGVLYDPGTLHPYADIKAAVMALGGMAALMILAYKSLKGRALPTDAKWMWTMTGFILLQFVSLFWVGSPGIGLKDCFLWGSFGCLALCAMGSTGDPRFVSRLLRTFALLGVLNAIWIVGQGVTSIVAKGKWPSSGLFNGTLGFHNVVAFFLLLALPGLVLWSIQSKGVLRAGLLLGSVIVVAAILFCQSRTAYLGLLLEVFAAAWFAWRGAVPGPRRVVIGGGVGILIVAMVGVLLSTSQVPGGILSRTQEDLSQRLTGRRLTWLIAVDMVRRNPLLGVGAGGFAYNYMESQGRVLEDVPMESYLPVRELTSFAHNEFLQSLCETGPLGALLLLFVILYPLGRLLLRNPRDSLAAEAACIGIALVGMVPPMFLDFPFKVSPTACGTALVLGAGAGLCAESGKGTRGMKVLILVLGLVGAVSAVGLTMDYLSSRSLTRAHDLDKAGDRLAERYYERAAVLASREGEPLTMKASYLLRMGDDEEGEKALLDSLRTYRDPLTYKNLGRLYARQGRHSEAIAMFLKSREGGIHYFKDTCEIARSMAALGETVRAQSMLEELLRSFPRRVWPLRTVGELKLQSRDFAGAVSYLTSFPGRERPSDLAYLGAAYLGLGNFDLAEPALLKALAGNPKGTRAWNNLGTLHFQQGDRIQAAQCYEKTLAIDPGNSVARQNLKLLAANPGTSAGEHP